MVTSEPNAGDVYWLEAPAAHGHEQQGRRPVLIVTDTRLTSLGLAWAVPLTTTVRGWPLHADVHIGGRLSVAMCEQLRSIGVERLGRFIGTVSYSELAEVRSILHTILGH